jgi:aminoglycoside phosphotransferase (APT) family kinase protein
VDADLLARVCEAAGQAVEPVAAVHRGYAHNARWRVRLADGTPAFAKAAVDELTADWLRLERPLYDLGAPFMPALLGWADGARPVLLLEDLTDAHWPPPWRERDVDAVLAALRELSATAPPSGFQPPSARALVAMHGWAEIEADPAPFLALGLCGETWLAGALPALGDASAAAPFEGDALLHLDVRSDNICLRDGRAVLVDWNWVHVGNPLLDVAAWLSSLRVEGGPEPEEVCPEAGVFAPFFAGFWASVAGLPAPPTAPRVREVQLAQLRVALPWAARTLDLPPPT